MYIHNLCLRLKITLPTKGTFIQLAVVRFNTLQECVLLPHGHVDRTFPAFLMRTAEIYVNAKKTDDAHTLCMNNAGCPAKCISRVEGGARSDPFRVPIYRSPI